MEDIAFPRGGPTKAPAKEQEKFVNKERPSQHKKRKQQEGKTIQTDFLFGSGNGDKNNNNDSQVKKQKVASSASSPSNINNINNNRHSLLPLGGGGVVLPHNKIKKKKDGKLVSTTSPIIEALSFSKLSKGTKILACVREVHDEFAVFSLPNLLSGYCLLNNNNNNNKGVSSLKQCLTKGQILAVVVQKVVTEQLAGGVQKKRIQVSALPSLVNPRDTTTQTNHNDNTKGGGQPSTTTLMRGQILSVEDHGCLVDLGLGRKGFLKFDQIEKGNKQKKKKSKAGEHHQDDTHYTILDDEDEIDEETEDPTQRILQAGRLYDFYPASSSSSSSKGESIIPLRLPSADTVAKQLILPIVANKHSSPHTLSSLLPGMMVTAKVEALAKNGLCVTFLGNVFRGAIEMGSHMGGVYLPPDNTSSITIGSSSTSMEDAWKKVFDNHQHFPARIVAIDVATKLIRLSIAPSILMFKAAASSDDALSKDLTHPTHIPSVGTIVDDCTVVKVDPGIGALMALPARYRHETNALPSRITGRSDLFENQAFQQAVGIPTTYVHISKAIDDVSPKSSKNNKQTKADKREAQVGQFSKEFSVGSKHSVRILSTSNWMDGVAAGACAPSILKAHVLTHSDLQAGQVYKQVPVVARLAGGSVLINLGGSPGNPVRGLIPSPMHLMDNAASKSSDFRKKVMDTKFAVDAKVDVRILWVDHKKKKCVLTAKKSMVKVADDSQIVSSYKDLELGQTAVGFVSRVDQRSLFVTFCNKVYGKVTAKSLASELGIERISDSYQVGDVVTCRVVKITKSTSNGRSMALDQDEDEVDMDTEEEQKTYYQVLLSLKVRDEDDMVEEEDDNEPEIDASNPQQIRIKAGAILPEKSMKIVELVKGKRRSNGNGFVPGYAIVAIKSKYLLEEPNMLSQIECKLPFDQLLDNYKPADISSSEALDAMASRLLKAGKKINQKAIVLLDPKKSNVDHSSGVGRLTVVSLRPMLIATMESQKKTKLGPKDILIPTPKSDVFVGALVQGYVAQIDPRHGAFLRFLDGMTGLIPRMNGGLNLTPYATLVAKVQVIDDTVKPSKIMLQPVSGGEVSSPVEDESLPYSIGDTIPKVRVTEIQPAQLNLKIVGDESGERIQVAMHVSMKDAPFSKVRVKKSPIKKDQAASKTKGHPFFGIIENDTIKNVTVASVVRRRGAVVVQVTDRELSENDDIELPTFVGSRSELKAGMSVSAVVTAVEDSNKGLQVHVSPLVHGFIPGLELSKDLTLLNDLASHVAVGSRLKCVVMDQSQWHENRAKSPFASHTSKSWMGRKSTPEGLRRLFLSVLAVDEPTLAVEKPARGDIVVGRVSKSLPASHAPAMMLSLRGGFVGRCCITELAESDDWENMPLGRMSLVTSSDKQQTSEEAMDEDSDDESENEENGNDSDDESVEDDDFSNGKYVQCRVLKAIPKQSVVDISLRGSRIEGDMDDDETPPVGETVQAYVIQANKKGCFVRLARQIEGRVTLKELCDGFLPNPSASFPMGRLVVGKVKSVKTKGKSKNSKDPTRIQVDLDMRESTLLEHQKKLSFEDIELDNKYKGTVTRVETYGVFVQIENSSVSGLVHMSQCSDNFIKNLQALYNPGDLVKILVVKKDVEGKKLGFSMKASHFEADEDSDDEDTGGSDSEMETDDGDIENVAQFFDEDAEEDELDSDDENFASNLAAKMEQEGDGSEEEDDEDSEDADDSDEDSDDSEEEDEKPRMETTVGFDWSVGGASKQMKEEDSSDESDSDDEDDSDEDDKTSSNKSRKKQAQRRREEQEISWKELSLADGTADENPETAGDFERLLAGSPNSSELWIRYMAFHLSLADVTAARAVAEKALARIEFQEEREKLNVWTAVLTLEHKYGSDDGFQKAIARACGQNNPKQVYLRACEILEKDVSTADTVARADALFAKMCKKFKSKKQVWLAHLSYLLKQSRYQEAHALLKRAFLSLPPYKHAETMSRFAQLEFEFGSAERARTVYDGIILKYPKRLDLLFVYVDKEIKYGSLEHARSILKKKVDEAKLSDKQMKSLFKKWYRMEELHGDEESTENVKDAAREYVQRS